MNFTDGTESGTDNQNKNAVSSEPTWELVTGRKRTASINRDPRKIARQGSVPLTTNNRYEPIAATTDEPLDTTTKDSKPPPIIIKGISQYGELIKVLDKIGGPQSYLLRTTASGITLYSTTSTAYRSFIHFLEAEKAEFHTYQLPDQRAHRIVIKGLHPSTPKEMIVSDLQQLGYVVRNLAVALSKRDRMPLPMFFVDIEPASYNTNIYKVEHLVHSKIKIEEPYKRRTVVQCSRCLNFGHTKTYCRHAHRCIRCGQNHISGSCGKTRDTSATCANCNEKHPANYKGCAVYKNLCNMRRPLKPHVNPAPPQTPDDQADFPSLPTLQNTTVTRQSSSSETASHPVTSPHFNSWFQQRHSNIHHAKAGKCDVQPPLAHSLSSDTGSILHLLNEFKNLLQPLFALVTQLTHLSQSLNSLHGR